MKKFLILLTVLSSVWAPNLAFASSAGTLVSSSNEVNVYPDAVFRYLMSYDDVTAEAASSTSDDVALGNLSTVYIGANSAFESILFDISSAGSSTRSAMSCPFFGECHHFDLEYYNGLTETWEDLDYTDNTNSFQTAGENSWDFELPAAWDDESNTKETVNGSTLYWVRITMNSNTSSASTAYASEIALRAYNVELTVTDAISTPIETLVSEDLTVTGGTSNSVAGFRDMGSGVYQVALDADLSDSNYEVNVAESGYSDESFSTGVLSTIQKAFSVALTSTTSSSSLAEYEIDVSNENGVALTGLHADNFSIGDATDTTLYAFANNGGGSYTLQLATGNSDNNYKITIAKSGYVSTVLATGELTSGTYSDSAELSYAYKVSVEDEDGTAVSDAEVMAGDLMTVCDYIGSGDYGCPVPLGQTDYSYRVEKSSYQVVNGSFASDRTNHSDAQQSESVQLELLPVSCEAPFTDTYGHWAEGYIQELYCREVVSGRSSTLYVPNDNVTRAEFLKIALLNAGFDVSGATGADFTDVDSGDWFYEYVSYGANNGFIEGYDNGTFRPNASINRAEALVITMRIAGLSDTSVSSSWNEFDDVDSNDWFAYAVKSASDQGIVEGYDDGSFRPENPITRAEVSAVAVRTYNIYYAE